MNNLNLKIANILKKGDVEGFSRIFSEFHTPLYEYSRRYISDPDDAEDIVQNVFIKVWEKRETLVIKSSFKAYLHKMVTNLCLNTLKQQEVKNEYVQELKIRMLEEDNHRIFEEADTGALVETETIKKLQLAIEDLPDICQKIFKMSRFSNMKNKEIAYDLNISVRTVETQIYRALKLLRKRLLKEKLVY